MLTFVLMAAAFEVASLKPSLQPVGPDANNRLTVTASGRSNVTLKRLIGEAWGVEPYQVSGPGWLGADEFEIEARAGRAATREELREMLRTLLGERFRLAVHRESREMRVYELTVAAGGAKVRRAEDGASRGFRGTMQEFANLLAVQLTIAMPEDPGSPGRASGAAIPVIDRTALSGTYEIGAGVRPEAGGDMFALWQRVLREELGLRLEGARRGVEMVVVDGADRVPAGN